MPRRVPRVISQFPFFLFFLSLLWCVLFAFGVSNVTC
jgi:hypothetical protein